MNENLAGSAPARGEAYRTALLVAGAVSCCAVLVSMLFGLSGPFRVTAALATFCLGPGVAALPLRGRSARVELALVVAVSLSFFAVAAQVMLWVHAWEPEAAMYIIASACLAAILVQLREGRGGRSRAQHASAAAQAEPAMPVGFAAPVVAPRAVSLDLRLPRLTAVLRTLPRPAIAHLIAIAVAAVCWVISLLGADLTRISGYGLLPALPFTYYIALVILVGGFALAATAPGPRPAVLAAYVIALIVVLHGTTAILYSEPRYAWVYKHLGVIDLIARTGDADRSADIYNNWPGFFAVNAWFREVAAVAPIGYAAWAQVFFGVLNVSAIVFALRGVTRDARLLWTSAWLFVVANWIGQDYLAPQAFSFFLAIVLIGLVIRWGTPVRWTTSGSPRTKLGERIRHLTKRLTGGMQGPPLHTVSEAGDRVGVRAALIFGGLCYLAIVISHQLSPIMVMLSIFVVAIVTRRVSPWVLVGLLVVEAWWLWLSYDFVSAHFELLDVDPGASARPAYDLSNGLPGVALGADASRASILVMLLLAAVGVVRRLRSGLWDAAPLVLMVVPAAIILGQSYGGEGPLRGYLFALPWLAFFAAVACQPSASARSMLGRAWRLGAVSLTVGAGALLGYFGQEMINKMSSDDVAASRWFLANSPREATLAKIDSNFPERLDARYVQHLDSSTPLIEMPGFTPHRLGPADVQMLAAEFTDDPDPPRYVGLSPSQENYTRYYRLLPPGSVASFAALMQESPNFQLVYRRGSAYIFRFVSRPS